MSASACPRFALGDDVHDLRQGGKIVTIGGIIYRDDPSNRDYRYQLGCSAVIRRERDLEPLEVRVPASSAARELKRTVDFVAIVSRYTRLRRAGRQFVGLCPFHSETSPSFYVHPERKTFKCFGCERGGDLFTFVMLAERCSFVEALQVVAGVARESEPRSGERFRVREGAKPLARVARVSHSPQSERDAILARLDATEARVVAICAANDAAAMEFATACEPMRGDGSLLLVNKRITGHE